MMKKVLLTWRNRLVWLVRLCFALQLFSISRLLPDVTLNKYAAEQRATQLNILNVIKPVAPLIIQLEGQHSLGPKDHES